MPYAVIKLQPPLSKKFVWIWLNGRPSLLSLCGPVPLSQKSSQDTAFLGTHDNETMEGWWKDSAGKQDKEYVKQYLGLEEVTDISWTMLREALKSVSRTSIVMMQVVSASPLPLT